MAFENIENEGNLKRKRVLLRLDLNVPMSRGKVVDAFRIEQSIPTIELLRDAGAKIIIISHVEGKGGESLEPVFKYLESKKLPIKFIKRYFTVSSQKAIDNLKEGEIILFENVRLNKGEKENKPEFAKKLASMVDIYVNEAFSVSHREHASVIGVTKFLPSFAGPLFMREVKNLSKVFNPPRPFIFVLGGAKFDTKMPLLDKFLSRADTIFVGGALANNFFKELGFEIGKSVVSSGNFKLKELLNTRKIVIPTDVTVQTGKKRSQKFAHEVGKKDAIWDVGNDSLVQLQDLVKQARFVLWNGPLGNYEIGFTQGTEKLAQIIANANAESIVGGGDTVAAIQTLKLMDKFTFVSTGGGAMLDFLVKETLPGIQALEKSK